MAGRLNYIDCLELILCELHLCRWEKALTFAGLMMEKIKERKPKDEETKLLEQFAEALSAACNGILTRNVHEVEESLRKFNDIRSRLGDEVEYYGGFVKRSIETLEYVKQSILH